MNYLLHPGEPSLFKELKDVGYYVWMNDRNDLAAGQFPGWAESHASEIYYGGQTAHPSGRFIPNREGHREAKTTIPTLRGSCVWTKKESVTVGMTKS